MFTDDPFLSIIVPVYNTRDYVSACVGSITAQGFDDYELILVDDGSTDGSGALCDTLALGDDRVCCLHQQNAGVSSARNRGLDAARGAYVWFCDSDDEVAPGALGLISSALLDGAPDILAFPVEQVDGAGRRLGLVPAPRPSLDENDGPLQCGDPLYPVAHVFKRALLEGLRFDTSLALLEDRDFFYRLCWKAAGSISVLDTPLYKYLITRESSAVNSLEISKYIDSVRVNEWILENEIARGCPSPAYELFVEHALGVLSRACRAKAPKSDIDAVTDQLKSHWDYRRLLPGKIYAKYLLAVKGPGAFRLLSRASGALKNNKPGQTVLAKET